MSAKTVVCSTTVAKKLRVIYRSMVGSQVDLRATVRASTHHTGVYDCRSGAERIT